MFQSDAPHDTDPSTPDTSLVVGLIFAATLFSVVAFLVFKRVRCLFVDTYKDLGFSCFSGIG